jgi:hypothetical protein
MSELKLFLISFAVGWLLMSQVTAEPLTTCLSAVERTKSLLSTIKDQQDSCQKIGNPEEEMLCWSIYLGNLESLTESLSIADKYCSQEMRTELKKIRKTIK